VGVVSTQFDGYGDVASGEALQSDGKIVVAGMANESGGGSDFALLRYNANGTLDKSFNGTGKVTTAFSVSGVTGSHAGASAVAIQTNGAIVAAGGSGNNIALARYNPDGSLDTTFGGTGIVTQNYAGGYDYGNSVAVQSDGKIVVTGTIQISGALEDSFETLRYNTNGTLDTTFNGSGIVTTTFNAVYLHGYGQSVHIQTDGKILVGGGAVGGASTSLGFAVARYNSNGSLDASFNGKGKVTVNLSSYQGSASSDTCYSLALQGDGKIVLAGATDSPVPHAGPALGLVRLNTNGSLDTTFNGTGRVITAAGSAAGERYPDLNFPYAAVVSGTKILVSTTGSDGTHNTFTTISYTASGALHPTFHPSGGVTVPVGASHGLYNLVDDNSASAVAIAPGGKILLAGSDFNGASVRFALVRLNADGSPDPTFNGSGKVLTSIGGHNDLANSVAVQPDGKILVAGNSSNGNNDDFAVARYNTDGSLDTTFHSTGTVTTDLSGGDDEGYGVAVQTDGKIVVAGTAQIGSRNVFAAVRYNTDGSLDTTFGSAGKVLTSIGTGDSFGKGLALQADGKILVAGYAYGTGNYDFALVRYNTNGSLDTNFVLQGKDTTAVGHADDLGRGVAVQPDGKILVAGASYTGTIYVSTLVRYNSNGSLDTSFNPSGHTGTISVAVGTRDYSGSSVALQTDGKIVLAGTASNGSSALIAVQRYTASGVPDTSFNGTGQVTTGFNAEAFGNSVALQPDGKIVVGGASSNGVYDNFAAVRYAGGQ
jgi:uncharacterized delta-60 repeat protein